MAQINHSRLSRGAQWRVGQKSRIMHGSLKNRAEILIPTRLVVQHLAIRVIRIFIRFPE